MSDAFNRVRQKSRRIYQRAVDRTKMSLEEAEGALRCSMPTRKSVHISSHPDADPEGGLVPPETAVDTPVEDDSPREEQKKPIVSINGTDVEQEERKRDAA